MNIVIVGAGFTGVQLARLLINEKNQVTVIDNDEDVIRHASNQLDCSVIVADGNNLDTLEDAGIAKADALVCVTSSDEVNMITCSLVDAVYPDVLKIARVRNYAYYVNTASAEKKQSINFGGKRRPLYGINYMIHPDVEAADAIVQAVEYGGQGYFPNGTYPVAGVFIQINPQLIDFNIHPAKKEARFYDISDLHHGLSSSLRNFFHNYTCCLVSLFNSYYTIFFNFTSFCYS